ncbi:MAG: error-prone DNA polymerase [Leucobacter sp.]
MGWRNSDLPWEEFERTLSGRADPDRTASQQHTAASPAREMHAPADPESAPYAELHAHSHYSFLDGASSPESLMSEAARLGLAGLALTDHNGLYGAARLAEAADSHPEVLTVYGAELSLDLDAPQLGVADPVGTHLLVLADGPSGYRRLTAAITEAQLDGGEKGRPVYDLERLAEIANGEWAILTGCRKGAVPRALAPGFSGYANNTADREDLARTELHRLTALFGADQVFVELTDHGHPGDDALIDQLAALAAETGVPTLATGAVHYARREEAPLAEAMAAIRSRRSLDELDPFLPASGVAHLSSGDTMQRRFAEHSDAVARTVPLAQQLAFPLRSAVPGLPHLDVPNGHTQMSWLRHLVFTGVHKRYGHVSAAVTDRLERELAVIEQKDFPGYFLIVYDLVREARERGILCQGRGSAANSAVCYMLEITAVDAIYYDLPFERFLSSIRDEEPDIDVDFDSERREEIIQYAYERYGRQNAAQVANVISYRPKAATRDAAKALGYGPGQQRAWTRGIERWGGITAQDADKSGIPQPVTELATQLLGAPRHLGIHPGGMVLTRRPVGEVCPIEHARMENRTVLQWDKDDCAAMGLVKFDMLGLGMLSALRATMDLVEGATGESWTLDSIPKEEAAVYDMLCRADAIGVFQLESRAQLGTLPRLKPRQFYDLVIEIALIRPGPMQGGAVHPYLRRRNGEEPVTYPHPVLEDVLRRTLGIPLFQEQLMQMAVAIGNCSAEDADLLRRSMGSKRGEERVTGLKTKLFAGMADHGLDDAAAANIYAQIQAFASFGFAESHSLSFALLVYASSWFKLHYPAAFLAGLLQSQPMGFYSPRTLVEDARRHGVTVHPPDVQRSEVSAMLELSSSVQRSPGPSGLHACTELPQPPVGAFDPQAPDTGATHRRDAHFAVRLGLAGVRGIDEEAAKRITGARGTGPFLDLADLARRADLNRQQLEALATAGACASLGLSHREAVWAAAPAADNRERFLPGIAVHVQPPLLPLLTPAEQISLELWSTGVTTGTHPVALLRDVLDTRGTIRSDRIHEIEPGSLIETAGLVTHRQRPGTAGGVTFMTLEDESGSINVIIWSAVWERYRSIARVSPALIVRGTLQRSPDGVANLIANRFEPLSAPTSITSRDFH